MLITENNNIKYLLGTYFMPEQFYVIRINRVSATFILFLAIGVAFKMR